MERPRPDPLLSSFFSSGFFSAFLKVLPLTQTLPSPKSTIESLLFFDMERARVDISLMMERPRSESFSSGFSFAFVIVLPLLSAPSFLRVADLERLRTLELERFLDDERDFFFLLAFSIVFARVTDLDRLRPPDLRAADLDRLRPPDLRVTDLERLRSPDLRVTDLERLRPLALEPVWDDERPLALEGFVFSPVMTAAASIIICEKDVCFLLVTERLRLRPLLDFERPACCLDFEADFDRPRLLDERLFEDLASLQVNGELNHVRSCLMSASIIDVAMYIDRSRTHFLASGAEASSAAGSSRASSIGLSPRVSLETGRLLPSRTSMAATSDGDDDSTPASVSCLAGSPAVKVTVLAEWADIVGDPPVTNAGGAAVSMFFSLRLLLVLAAVPLQSAEFVESEEMAEKLLRDPSLAQRAICDKSPHPNKPGEQVSARDPTSTTRRVYYNKSGRIMGTPDFSSETSRPGTKFS